MPRSVRPRAQNTPTPAPNQPLVALVGRWESDIVADSVVRTYT
jgi:hypothetical protein